LGRVTTGGQHVIRHTGCLGPSLLRGLLNRFTGFAKRPFHLARCWLNGRLGQAPTEQSKPRDLGAYPCNEGGAGGRGRAIEIVLREEERAEAVAAHRL
jgi:hypothetical protein